MNIEFKWVWDANSLGSIPNKDGKKDYVVELHWRYRGILPNEDPNKNIIVDDYGVQNFLVEDNNSNYIPFEQLNEEIIVKWLEPYVNIDEIESKISNEINNKINPPIIYSNLPN